MIVKIIGAADFGRTGRYLIYGSGPNAVDDPADRVLWADTPNMAAGDRWQAAVRVMEATSATNSRVQEPAYHFVVSWGEGEKVSPDVQREVMHRMLREMGLDGHQVLMVAHHDTDKPHVHCLVNRIDPETGKAWSKHNDARRFSASARQIEQDYGFEVVQGRHRDRAPTKEQPAPLTELEYWRARQSGAEPFPVVIKGACWEDFQRYAQDQNRAQLEEALGRYGLRIEPKGGGYIVTDGKEVAKLSSISPRGVSNLYQEQRSGRGTDVGAERAGADRPGSGRGAEPPTAGGAAGGPGRAGGADRGAPAAGDRRGAGGAGQGADRARGDGEGRGRDRTGREPGGLAASPAAGDGQRPGGADPLGAGGRGADDRAPGRAADPYLDRMVADLGNLRRIEAIQAHRAVAERALRDAQGRVGELEKVERRALGDRAAFVERLRSAFTDPERAAQTFTTHADRDGWQQARTELVNNPATFGQLRGRTVLGVANEERRAALASLPTAADTAGTYLGSRAAAETAQRPLQEAREAVRVATAQVQEYDAQLQRLGERVVLEQRTGRAMQTATPEQRQELARLGLLDDAERTLRTVQSQVRSAANVLDPDERGRGRSM
ncbi:MAG: relaxase/mobilization nuclease domain-containing protein [Gemmatimonadota bacterium]